MLAILLINPLPAPSSIRQSLILEALDAAFRRHTPFRARPLDAPLTSCEGRISCLAGVVSRSGLLADSDPSMSLVLAVSIRSEDGAPDSLMPILWDQAIAEGALSASGDGAQDALAFEASLSQAAILWRGQSQVVADPSALDGWAASLIAALEPPLAARAAWKPFASLELAGALQGAAIELDGRVLGVSSSTLTRLENVAVGEHALRVVQASFEPLERRVQVQSDALTRVQVELIAIPDWSAARLVVAVLGISAISAAGSIALWSSGLSKSREAWCVPLQPEAHCPGEIYASVGPAGGPAVLPLAVSLAAGGTATLLTDLLLSPESELNVTLPLGIGLATAALAFGITSALAPGSPEDSPGERP